MKKVEYPDEIGADITLIRQTLIGNKAAFEKLINKHHLTIYTLVLSYVKNASDAEDLTQEVFIKAYQNLIHLKNHKQFSSWLQQIARNHCIDWLRHHRKTSLFIERIIEKISISKSKSKVGDDASAEAKLLHQELIKTVTQAINSLPETERQLIKSYYLDGVSYKQLQEEHGLSYFATAHRLHRAKEKIRKTVRKLLQGLCALPWQKDLDLDLDLDKLLLGGIKAVELSLKTKIAISGAAVVILLVLFQSHYELNVDMPKENGETDQVTTTNKQINKSLDKKDSDKQIDEAVAWLESLERKSSTELTVPSEEIEEISPENTSDPSDDDSAESRQKDVAEKEEKVAALVAQMYESAEAYRKILLRRKDLSSGRGDLYPEVDPARYPGKELREYIQAQVNIHNLLEEYLSLTNDYDAFNPGGWINQTFSGMMRMSASADTKTLRTGFTDEMIRN